ncbi:MAG TPA: DUF2190 family protein [Candidatus Sumerlaeota bacterium]|nr:MAG: hypothetical protein BWY90_00055 [Deltaproteobacteria bacterium ADurb.BinA014]HOE64653.1 DUF2190 family protein [Candidatus Sumerlaeota bacterium]HRR31983.1 DUF2190 family protein [Candidatus Sumerlaeia bacterium]HOR65950.1 DUF2190 family protein [Candidatus Sumerlaeota bacterium]HPL75642.1 DUF2190 family protein [Candidatus Sumerlaeota bacterium]
MSQYVETSTKSFIAGATIAANTLVKLTAVGKVETAELDDAPIGVALEPAAANGHVAVKLLNCDGTVKMIAAGAISANAKVYCKNDGKCDDTTSSSEIAVGYALEAAGADGDIIEVLPFISQS